MVHGGIKLLVFRDPWENNHPLLAQVYELWKNVWDKANREEFNLDGAITSDSFLSQHAIYALFRGPDCLALCGRQDFDLNNPAHLQHSYLKTWPQKVLQQAKELGDRICNWNHLTLNPDKSLHPEGPKLRDLFLGLALPSLKSEGRDLILATPRRERNIHLSTYRTGALKLLEDIPYCIEGQRIDLVAWSRRYPGKYAWTELQEICEMIWEKRTVHSPSTRTSRRNDVPNEL